MNEASEKPAIRLKPVILYGARAIAKYLNLTPRKFYHRMSRGQIKGISRMGGTLTATEETLAANFPQPDEKAEPSKPGIKLSIRTHKSAPD